MITLSLLEIHSMLEILAFPPHLRKFLEELKHTNNKSISADIANELRDLCTEKLDEYGFDVNYNPTEEGKKLEALIDKLYLG